MTDAGGTPKTKDEVLILIEAALQEVYAVCGGKRRWTMCVPVQPDDSDEVIAGALLAARDLVKSHGAETHCSVEK